MKVVFARVASAAVLALAAPAQADTLVDHVAGETIDATGGVEHFTGLVIGSDGRIAQVLHEGEKRPTRPDYAVEGHGAVMLPGLIDAHVHIFELGFQALTLDLGGAHSLADVQTRIAAYAAAHPDRPWIIGSGWNQEDWAAPGTPTRFPTAADLDAAVADRPVVLTRVDGHAVWTNSRGLALAGVTAATPDPAGGRIMRIAAPSPPRPNPRSAHTRLAKPSGVFVDTAMALIEKVVPPPRPEDRDLALATAQTILLSHGVSAIANMSTTIEDWQAFRRAGDAGSLRVRIMAYALGVDNMALIAGSGPTPWLYDDRLRMGGLKLFADGALGSRGAWLKAPYSDEPATHGTPRLSGTQLRNLMSRGAIDHFQVAVHAIGDAANADVLSAIDELSATYTGDRRWRIEHAQIIDPADMARFGAHGIVASMQPVHAASDRAMAEARLGPERLAWAYAWKSIAATGATLAFGSDAPTEAPDPFAGMAAAISRQGPDGKPDAGWQPQERICAAAALAAYTTGAAYAGFAEGRIGRIALGMRADFVLVDRDPLTVSPAALRQTKVLQVWVGGRPMLENDAAWKPASKPEANPDLRGTGGEGR